MKGLQKPLVLWLICMLVIGGAAAFLPIEHPRYHGRSFNDWIVKYQRANREHDEATQRQALEAVRHIGTNGFPWLLKSLRAERPRWKWGYYWTIDRIDYFAGRSLLYPLLEHLDAKEEAACYRAVVGFGMLGPKAAPAVLDIARVAEKNPFMALKALRLIGCESLPGFVAVSTNQTIPEFVRLEATKAIWEINETGRLDRDLFARKTGPNQHLQPTPR